MVPRMTTDAGERWLPLIPVGLGALMLVLALVFAGLGWRGVRGAEAVRSWPSVEGTITGCGQAPFKSEGETQYQVRIVTGFRYEVNGKPYEFSTSEYAGWEADVADQPLPYAKDQKVTIYVDPLDPKNHALSNRGDWSAVPFAVSLLCVVISLPFLILGGRWLLRTRSKGAAPV